MGSLIDTVIVCTLALLVLTIIVGVWHDEREKHRHATLLRAIYLTDVGIFAPFERTNAVRLYIYRKKLENKWPHVVNWGAGHE